MTELRVWHLTSNRWNSAITEYALSAARALELAGCHSIFTPLAGSPAEARARAYSLETRPLLHFGLTARSAAAAIAQEASADVVLTYGGPETFLAQFGSVQRGAAFVRFRGQDVESRAFASLRHKVAHRHVDLALAPSEMIAGKLRELDSKKPVRTVLLGCDAAKYGRSRQELGERAARPEIVVLGRLDPVKGHAAAISFLQRILARGNVRPRLHVIGEPANLSVAAIEAEVAAQRLVLGDDVIITARRVDDVAHVLAGAALGLVPSLGSEIICRVAEEFLLCGTPIIVSGVGSLDEVLIFDGAGASYATLTPDAASLLIEDWVTRSAVEHESAKAFRAKAAQRLFSLEAMGASLKEALDVAIASS